MRVTVKAKLDDVADRVAKYVFAETDPSVLLTVENGVPRSVASMDIDGKTIKNRYREELRGEVLRLKTAIRDQFGQIVAAAAGDDDRANRREAFLEDDLFLAGYTGDRREAFRQELVDYFDDVVDVIDPMLRADVAADGGSPGFWEGVAATYDEEEARAHLETFARPRDLLREYEDELALVMDLSDSTAPVDELDHTAETVRTVAEAIDHVVETERTALVEAYGG